MLSRILALLLCISPVLAGEPPVYLTYLGARQGEVEPCGCKVKQNGGLNRLFERLLELRKKGAVVFVDAGDTFFTMPQLNPNRVSLEKRKALLIAKSYKKMGLQAFSPGEKDFALGPDYLLNLISESGAQLISANLEFQKADRKPATFKIIETNGFKLMVTGLTLFEGPTPTGVKVFPAEEALKNVINLAEKEKADRLIVLSHLGKHEDEKLANKYANLFIMGSREKNIFNDPLSVGQSFIFEAGYDGQRLGEVELKKTPKGFSTASITELSKEFDKPNAVKKLMEQYFADLKNLPTSPMKNLSGSSLFVANPYQCQSCHEEQFNFWKNTKHSSAILVLYAKNQHHNPECIGCHSLGFQNPDGFENISDAIVAKKQGPPQKLVDKILERSFAQDKKEPLDSRQEPDRHQKIHQAYWRELDETNRLIGISVNFLGVQCEHCHGNRAEHVQSPGNNGKSVSTASCVECHKAPNAPEFDPKSVSLVACPKMKKAFLENR